MSIGDTTRTVRLALLLAALGFLPYWSETRNWTTSASFSIGGGPVTRLAESHCSHTDYAALLFGVLAILVGTIAAARTAGGPWETKTLNMTLSLGAVLIGGLHILRGFGAVGGPC